MARFCHLRLSEPTETDLAAFLPSPRHALSLLRAADPLSLASLSFAFAGYKRLCDVLLPELRSRSHLYNLIYRHRSNYSLVLREGETTLGGATFRLILDTCPSPPLLMLEVLLLAVDQREGVCGRGHGTRLVNAMKSLALRHAREHAATPSLLTQSDLGLPARCFWGRQGLVEGGRASDAVCALHEWQQSNPSHWLAVECLWLGMLT
ncbi:MAG: hypothetical protein SGPRY_010351 [Prymnesium sp.]